MSNNYDSKNTENTKYDAATGEDESVVILAASHKKGILRIIFSRFLIIALLLLLQIAIIAMVLIFFARNLHFFYAIYAVFAIVMVLYLFNCNMDSSAKLTWMFIIALLPIAGALFLAYTNSNIGHRKLKEFTLRSVGETMDELPQDRAVIDEAQETQGIHAAFSGRNNGRTASGPGRDRRDQEQRPADTNDPQLRQPLRMLSYI